MKKLLCLAVGCLVLGAGCWNQPVAQAPQPTPAQPNPQPAAITSTGCTPKAIEVLQPTAGETVTLPLTVKVRVTNGDHPNCRWSVSEAVAGPIRLLDQDGVTVGAGSLHADGDWMTDGPVNFTGQIPALSLVQGQATLVLTEDNPKGDPNPQEVMVPLTVQAGMAATSSTP